MGDAGEGLIDAEGRIQERQEELERERTRLNHGKVVRDPAKMAALESLRLVICADQRRRGRDEACDPGALTAHSSRHRRILIPAVSVQRFRDLVANALKNFTGSAVSA